ncbi:MAG TPA: hypothetical protein VG759_26115 [Candidatus Angelobacter sp.]|jgi:hypothetical protein|nr:hypothetical protein [Candidatus Angelobacter sp.]
MSSATGLGKQSEKEEYLRCLESEYDQIQGQLDKLWEKREPSQGEDFEGLPPDYWRLVDKRKDVTHRIEQTKKELEAAKIRDEVNRARKVDRIDSILRHSVLVFGCAAFIGLAYLFKSTPTLALIPLLGFGVFVILWPVFEKFRLLERVSAEFRPKGINISVAATNTDEYLYLQSELARKKLELETAKVQRELDSVRAVPALPPLASSKEEGSEHLRLGAPSAPPQQS